MKMNNIVTIVFRSTAQTHRKLMTALSGSVVIIARNG